ncbi:MULTISPECIES: radical SAM/SPASM domain-containing protein [unclassified Bradyrhizobium]|uniref:radical SAM/SPASM domain-containing protein n=1 Tax=unclassified Bradyrhizobium TaxID=2631580 RepID=UPI002916C487|nr:MULTISPECIES: radical SAM protein [unclassified Bradyrhizobium]
MIRLELLGKDGEVVPLFYDQHTSRLLDNDGFRAVDFTGNPMLESEPVQARPFIAVDYDQPGRKVREVKKLKIQLGLGCQKSCLYCLQAAQVQKAALSSTRDASEFLANIDSWIENPQGMEKVELWGGEPLLYWKHIEILAPALIEKFPNARFSMITNGELLTREIVDKLKSWDFSIAISHDGPGQHIRGDDPFEDPHKFAMIQYAQRTFHPRFSFNAVLTPASNDVNAIIDWFQDYFPGCNVGFEGVVHSYASDPSSIFSEEQLNEFSERLSYQLVDGSAIRSGMLHHKLRQAVSSMVNERSSEVLFQKCGMDMPEYLAVDLKGNVMTCQNVGANGNHKIGHVSDFDKIALNTSRHWSKRPECQSCPVLQLCQGACMYQGGDNWTHSCNAEFFYNLAFFRAALFILTGRWLVGFSGDIVRPKLKKDLNVEVR